MACTINIDPALAGEMELSSADADGAQFDGKIQRPRRGERAAGQIWWAIGPECFTKEAQQWIYDYLARSHRAVPDICLQLQLEVSEGQFALRVAVLICSIDRFVSKSDPAN